MTLAMVCATPAQAQQYMTNLQTAFAQQRPDLRQVVDHLDQNGNPVYRDDAPGVIQREITEHVFLVLTAAAQAQAAADALTAARTALVGVSTSVQIVVQ